jgi:hypothetical protein
MRTPTWVLGYHGCDRAVGEAVLAGETTLRVSENEWDWLGTGIYFWENSAQRALDWAEFAKAHPQYFNTPVKEPFTIGAVIDLGNCLDLLEAASIRIVKEAHEDLEEIFRFSESPLPINEGKSPDHVIRRLDCAVINHLHESRKNQKLPEFDAVRAAFFEGERLYSEAGFRNRTHIQLCVRNEAQIIGYFRVRDPEVVAKLNPAKSLLARRRATLRAVRRKQD